MLYPTCSVIPKADTKGQMISTFHIVAFRGDSGWKGVDRMYWIGGGEQELRGASGKTENHTDSVAARNGAEVQLKGWGCVQLIPSDNIRNKNGFLLHSQLEGTTPVQSRW